MIILCCAHLSQTARLHLVARSRRLPFALMFFEEDPKFFRTELATFVLPAGSLEIDGLDEVAFHIGVYNINRFKFTFDKI